MTIMMMTNLPNGFGLSDNSTYRNRTMLAAWLLFFMSIIFLKIQLNTSLDEIQTYDCLKVGISFGALQPRKQ